MHWYVLYVIYFYEYELCVSSAYIMLVQMDRLSSLYIWAVWVCYNHQSGREVKICSRLILFLSCIRTKTVAHLFMLLPGWEMFKLWIFSLVRV